MLLRDACESIKLECAIRELGFVEIGWRTVAHAGLYFLEPIGFTNDCGPQDEALGFVLGQELLIRDPHSVRFMFISAREAFDMSEELNK